MLHVAPSKSSKWCLVQQSALCNWKKKVRVMSWLWKCQCVSVWCQWSKTFLRRWNPDDVVGQCRSFSHAVSNVVNCSIPLNVRMGCHSINVDVVAHVNLDRYQTLFTGLGNKRICSTWAEKLCRDLFFRNKSWFISADLPSSASPEIQCSLLWCSWFLLPHKNPRQLGKHSPSSCLWPRHPWSKRKTWKQEKTALHI